jgi:hypothetical protein
MNRFVWDLRYHTPPALRPDFTIAALPGATPALPQGPQVLPGTYTVRLTVDGRASTQPLTVKMDPRVTTTMEDLTRLFDLERRIAQAIEDDARALERLRASKAAGVSAAGVERALVRLNDGLAELLSGVDTGDVAPTAAASQAFADFRQELDQRIAEASKLR